MRQLSMRWTTVYIRGSASPFGSSGGCKIVWKCQGKYIPYCLLIYKSRLLMNFSLPVMYSGPPFLSIKEDVRRGWWGTCSPNLCQRILRLSRRQMRKETITKRPSGEFMILLKVALSQQLMPSPMNGFLLLRVKFGFLNLQKRGTPCLNLTNGIRKDKKPIRHIEETHLKGFRMDGQFYKGIEIANVFRMWRYWGQVLYVTNIQKVTGQGVVCTQSTWIY